MLYIAYGSTAIGSFWGDKVIKQSKFNFGNGLKEFYDYTKQQ